MGWIRIERSDVANYAQSDQIIGQPVAEDKGGFRLNGVMSLAMLNRIGLSIRLHGAMFFANHASRIEWSIRHRVSCSSGRFSIMNRMLLGTVSSGFFSELCLKHYQTLL